jgi:23S rRNA pseudouridine1911/1915/1917 synthase
MEIDPGIAGIHQLTAGPDDHGQRIDVVLARHCAETSRSRIRAWIDEARVMVGGAPAKASTKVLEGQEISVDIPAARPTDMPAVAIPLNIAYEDNDLLVIDKPRGMAVHPAPGTGDDTLVNALLAHCTELSGVGGVERPGIVHRLDKDTTGLLMVAKNDVAHHSLQAQIQQRSAKRVYDALVWGMPPWNDAVVDAPMGRHPTDRKKMAVLDPKTHGNVRNAVTEIHVVERFAAMTRLRCTLQTGRTHQIRVHCRYAGFPVVGDPLYGGDRKSGDPAIDKAVAALGGQALHARWLSFTHPRTGTLLEFESNPPPAMQNLIDLLRQRQTGD